MSLRTGLFKDYEKIINFKMHIIINSRGDEVIYQDYTLRHCWGFIHLSDYHTERDEKEGQIFHLYNNAIGIQLELLEYLENKYPKGKIKVYVKNFEKEDFYAFIFTKDFRRLAMEWEKETGKQAIYNYDKQNYRRYGKQIRLPINYFARAYSKQNPLTIYV